MKKILSVILALCLVFVGVLFSGCGTVDISLTGGPSYEDTVYGNGGVVVRKGDYLYFASGYVESSKLGSAISNVKGTVDNGGLYRARVTESGALEDKQLMVSKVVGFPNAGMYIFKDKIYFASPSTARDKTGVRYDLITFFSCNLDGSSLLEFYQTTEFDKDKGTFSMTMIDQKVYLLIYNGTKIIRIDENKKAVEMASDVTDVVFPIRENITNNEINPDTNECFVYYTKDTKSENSIDLGNTLYKKDIVLNVEKELFKEDRIEINLISITSNNLFYSRNSKESGAVASYYSNSLGENFSSSEKRHTMDTYTDFIALGEKADVNLGVAFIFNSKLYLRTLEQGINDVKELVSASSILSANNGYIYYVNSSDIYRVDVTATTIKSEAITGDLTPLTKIFDVDSTHCYFYVENKDVASGYSIYRIALAGLAAKTSTAEKIS